MNLYINDLKLKLDDIVNVNNRKYLHSFSLENIIFPMITTLILMLIPFIIILCEVEKYPILINYLYLVSLPIILVGVTTYLIEFYKSRNFYFKYKFKYDSENDHYECIIDVYNWCPSVYIIRVGELQLAAELCKDVKSKVQIAFHEFLKNEKIERENLKKKLVKGNQRFQN